MLSLCHGTDLEALAAHLLEELNQNPLSNPLAPEIFVVQNHGMGQWLSLNMARKQGIAANLKFEFPAERMWSLARVMDSGIPETLPSDRGPLAWNIMEVLGDKKLDAGLEIPKRYIQDDNLTQQALRRWKLSDKVAAVFDQYLVFRPDLLLDWENGKLNYDSETEKWQALLWQKLVRQWKENENLGNYFHRAALQEKLLKAIDERKLALDELPSRITVFGVSGMPPVFIKTLIKLSKLVDVHFYQFTIDSKIRNAKSFENPLLQSLGKEGTDFLSLLFRYVEDDREVSASFKNQKVPSKKRKTSSKFQQVRDDLVNNIIPVEDHQKKVADNDSTIQVHSCHSPMREVEVLYDQLLAVLDKNPEISPDDVLIMTPDIDTYAPMIEAVFGNPDEGQPQIPFSIADREISEAQAAIQAFIKILDLCESRFKVTEVLDLLDADPVKKAFRLSDDNFNRLEKWVRENRIRWGVDGSFKNELKVPPTENYTWKAGLDRMLLGYAMKPNDDYLYQNIFPYDEIETSDDAELAGKFSHFLNALFEFREQVATQHTPEDWVSFLKQIPDKFLSDSQDYLGECTSIRKAIEKIEEFADLADFKEKVPFTMIRSWLKEQLEDQTTGGGQMGRGVTFSSLVPMRSIPFKMIGMIGMNEGAFPRSKIPVEFDFMQKENRPGDRSRSNDDRYLFLENVLSAQYFLYFSYMGQSNRHDSKFPPSVVLKEFLDYLSEYYDWAKKDFIQEHHLQSFSPAYFSSKKYFSYSKTQRAVAAELLKDSPESNGFMATDLPEPDPEWKQLSVSDLIAFYQHPAKFVMQKRMGIYLREENVLTEDREPFALNGLDGYQVGQNLLDRYVKGKPLDSYEKVVKACDFLPNGWNGEQAYQKKVNEVDEFGSVIKEFLDRKPLEDCEVDLDIGEFRLTGKISNIFDESLIKYRFGRCRPKDLIEFWITHLIFQSVKPETHSGISRLFTKEKDKAVSQDQLFPPEDTRPILEELLEHYWQGLQCCTYFFPETSHSYANRICCKRKSQKEALKTAAYVWKNDYGHSNGEGQDQYNKLMINSKNPLEKQVFKDMAIKFWSPFFEAQSQEVN